MLLIQNIPDLGPSPENALSLNQLETLMTEEFVCDVRVAGNLDELEAIMNYEFFADLPLQSQRMKIMWLRKYEISLDRSVVLQSRLQLGKESADLIDAKNIFFSFSCPRKVRRG